MIVPEGEPSDFELRYVDDDVLGRDLDEVVARNCFLHIERMDDSWYWVGITTPDGETHMLHIGSRSRRAVVDITAVDG